MGATVTKTGLTVEGVLEQLRREIIDSPLHPDSDAALLNPSSGEGKAFRIEIGLDEEGYRIEDVRFREIPDLEARRIGLPLTVSKLYGPEPEEGEWLGTVHFE